MPFKKVILMWRLEKWAAGSRRLLSATSEFLHCIGLKQVLFYRFYYTRGHLYVGNCLIYIYVSLSIGACVCCQCSGSNNYTCWTGNIDISLIAEHMDDVSKGSIICVASSVKYLLCQKHIYLYLATTKLEPGQNLAWQVTLNAFVELHTIAP